MKDKYFQEVLQYELVKKKKCEMYHKLISFSQTMSDTEIDMPSVCEEDRPPFVCY